MPSMLQYPQIKPSRAQATVISNLLPTGLPKSACSSPTGAGSPMNRFRSDLFLTSASVALSEPGSPMSPSKPSLGQSASSPAMSTLSPKIGGPASGEDLAMRGAYRAVKGMLSAKDATVLNRIEDRLFNAGVDVRGQYHAHG